MEFSNHNFHLQFHWFTELSWLYKFLCSFDSRDSIGFIYAIAAWLAIFKSSVSSISSGETMAVGAIFLALACGSSCPFQSLFY
jgi:hypothetical protein